MAGHDPVVIPIPFRSVNVFAVRGDQTILVDTGMVGMGDAILDGLARQGVRAEEIALILITHCHPDHAGSAADLQERLGVPVAIHHEEARWLRAGRPDGEPIPVRPFGFLLKPLVKPEFPACQPDVLLDAGQTLDDYGIDVRILHTPGHSPGSVSLHFGNGECIAGDVMAGGFVRENKPDYPFFLDDRATLHRSIADLLAAGPERVYFGHGLPADATSIRRRFAAPLAQLARETSG